MRELIRKILKEENEVHNRLKKYFLSKFPELKTLKSKNKGEGRYDGIHHPKFTTFYYSEDEKVWFIEYDDRDIFSSTKWDVNDELESFWSLLSDDNLFEKIIKDVCNIDISNKGDKKYNWQFDDMSEVVIPKRIRESILNVLREQDESEYYQITPEEYKDLMKLSSYNPAVTKIKKFGGKPLHITGPLDVSRKNMTSLGNVAKIDGNLDISNTDISDISGIEIKGRVSDWDTPIHRKRLAAELRKKKEEAQERRDSGEWDLESTDDEGLKANALFEYLVDNGEIDVITDEEKEELDGLKVELGQLKERYDSSELEPENVSELYDKITEIEDRIEEIEQTMNDVYVIFPYKYIHYGLNTFEVIGIEGLRNNEYTVGKEWEMDDAALEYAKSYIDEVGIDGFRAGFIDDYIDEEEVRQMFWEYYNDDVRENPESFFKDSDYELTDKQEKRIKELEDYISELEDYIVEKENEQSELESKIEDPEEYSKAYDEIQEQIDEANQNKDDAQEEIDNMEPDKEPTEEMIDEKVDEIVDDMMSDPVRSLKSWGYEVKDYIDKDKLAQGLVDADGWGIMNGYDGQYDSVDINNKTYYIMRIN